MTPQQFPYVLLEREKVLPVTAKPFFGNNTAVFKSTQMLGDRSQDQTLASVQCWYNWWDGLMVLRWKGSRSLLPFVSVGNAVLHPGFDPAPIYNAKPPTNFCIITYTSIKKDQILSVSCWSMRCYLCIVFTNISKSSRWSHLVRKNSASAEMYVLWLILHSPNIFPVWTSRRLLEPFCSPQLPVSSGLCKKEYMDLWMRPCCGALHVFDDRRG